MSGSEPLESLSGGTFCFGCGPEVPCFTECCARLNLQLTPYDLLRLARRLGTSTSELVDRHALVVEETGKLPRLRLAMREEDGTCPFVTEAGCSVYEDRPSACRVYPLARAASISPVTGRLSEGHFVLREEHCKGFGRGRQWTAAEWSEDQGLSEYNSRNDEWLGVLARQGEVVYGAEADRRVRMFNLASYDLDGFRRFVLESGLTERFSMSERRVRALAEDDMALLRFAMQWLGFALYGERFNPERS